MIANVVTGGDGWSITAKRRIVGLVTAVRNTRVKIVTAKAKCTFSDIFHLFLSIGPQSRELKPILKKPTTKRTGCGHRSSGWNRACFQN